jgi:hypothetical protein
MRDAVMEERYESPILKIILICAIICCAVSLILPWGEVNAGIMGQGQFYAWGARTSSFLGNSGDVWFLYFEFLFRDSSIIFGDTDFIEIVIPMMMAIVVLPLLVIGIIYGISAQKKLSFSEKNIKSKDSIFVPKFSLNAGFMVVISIVLFYIFIQFGVITSNTTLSSLYKWSTGLSLAIISCVLFFGTYIAFEVMVKSQPYGKEGKEIPQKDRQKIKAEPELDATNKGTNIKEREETPKYCANCGIKIEGTPKFCHKCGHKLR